MSNVKLRGTVKDREKENYYIAWDMLWKEAE
jgi:hypothetical protein